jgi:ankyrin repeat protein
MITLLSNYNIIPSLRLKNQENRTYIKAILCAHLIEAVNNNQITKVKWLLAIGTPIDIKNNEGRTLLHIACFNNDTELVSLLIKKGAPLDEKGPLNNIPLHYACQNENQQLIGLLLDAGSIWLASNSIGNMPIDYVLPESHLWEYFWAHTVLK